MDGNQLIIETIGLSAAIAAVSITITRTKITEPLREALPKIPKIGNFLYKMTQCPYCTGHWVSLIAALYWQPYEFTNVWLVDLIITTMALTLFSALFGAVLFKSIIAMARVS